MSLRRRITLATTVAVALVALLVGVFGYLSVRSHLLGAVRTQLRARAHAYLTNPTGGRNGQPRAGTPGGDSGSSGTGTVPGRRSPSVRGRGLPGPAYGGAPGFFQSVSRTGKIGRTTQRGAALPVTAATVAVARSGTGAFYTEVTVNHTHLMLYTFPDRSNHTAVQVALPLTSDDSVLSELLLTYAILVGLGILLAGLIGAYVGRTALRPIDHFIATTERVSGDLDEHHTSALAIPARLEAVNAAELRRLAHSFNQTLDALERAIQAQRHLIADASHELRTPMSALRSNVQIFMEAGRLPLADRVELQDAIIAELDELTQLVADVLDLARGAAPHEHAEALELDTLVTEAIGRAQRRAPGLRFTTELEPTVIVNSPERVARAVTNVIDNARKWSPPDGEIEVTVKGGVLTVRDHGPGFTEADIGHVFDRFYRADEARRLPGSGLGLAIVKQVAEDYGGSVSARNATDGGAVIEVRFGSRPS